MSTLDDRLAGKNVLIVENEWLIADDLRRVLLSHGVNVVGPVASVDQAFDLIGRTPTIDAAILDIHLGNRSDVYPVARALQGRGIPFVFTTGYDKSSVRGDFAGTPHLVKPFNPAAIGPALTAASSKTNPP